MKIFTIILTVLIALTITLNAQITNSGFENWTTVGSYENPTGWATSNSSSTGSFYSCTKSTDHYPASVGNYSLRLENNTALTQTTGGWGMAATDTMAYPYEPSFPISGHPTSLTGYYKFNSVNSDTMFIRILLFSNGAMVCYSTMETSTTASDWTSFNLEIPSYTTADSAQILMSAMYPSSQFDVPNGNSVLYVDNLNFDVLITSISEQTVKSNFGFYPNPTSEIVTLNVKNVNNAELTLNIYNLTGTLVKSEILEQNNHQLNIGDLNNGVYMVEIQSKDFTENKRLIIQK
jgi:hypothetical protein